ncbi:MAG: hypothetical protein ABI673_04770 [Novosphingobium sp.]
MKESGIVVVVGAVLVLVGLIVITSRPWVEFKMAGAWFIVSGIGLVLHYRWAFLLYAIVAPFVWFKYALAAWNTHPNSVISDSMLLLIIFALPAILVWRKRASLRLTQWERPDA